MEGPLVSDPAHWMQTANFGEFHRPFKSARAVSYVTAIMTLAEASYGWRAPLDHFHRDPRHGLAGLGNDRGQL